MSEDNSHAAVVRYLSLLGGSGRDATVACFTEEGAINMPSKPYFPRPGAGKAARSSRRMSRSCLH